MIPNLIKGDGWKYGNEEAEKIRIPMKKLLTRLRG
jgi:hypothetical protein